MSPLDLVARARGIIREEAGDNRFMLILMMEHNPQL